MMDERKKVMTAVYVLTAILAAVIAWMIYVSLQEEETPAVYERKFDLHMGEIYIYQGGKDYIVFSDQKGYPVVKKAMLDAILAINGIAFSGQVFPEDTSKEKDPGGLTGVNQIKNTSVGLGTFLGTRQDLLTSIKSKDPAAYARVGADGYLLIPADQVAIFLSGEYKGLIFTRNSYEKREWVAWTTDREKLMKLVDLVREGTQKYEK